MLNIYSIFSISGGVNENFKQMIDLQTFIEVNYEDYMKVGYYRSSSVEYALGFGNDLVGDRFGEELSKIYPEVYFYDIWNREILHWSKPAQLPPGKKVLLQGTPFRDAYLKYKPDFQLRDVFGGEHETVYLLNSK